MSDHDNLPTVDAEEVFDPSAMKKKKKKSSKKTVPAAFDDESAPASTDAPAAADDDEELDFSKLKKKKSSKKSKKTVPEDLVADEDADEAAVEKPKKSKRAPSPPRVDYHAGHAAAADDDEDDLDGDEDENVEDIEDEIPDEETGFAFTSEEEAAEETWIGTDRDYTYDEILSRVFRILHEHNPALAGGRKRYTIVPPQVAREGSKKTVFANIDDICNRMRRNYDHVVQFLYAELGTSGSVDGSKRLIIKGRFQPKQIENVLRRYIVEYVTCKTCKSPETILRKENRLYFQQCESCGSTRSVSAIQGGFKAQVGSRKAAKAKAGA
ncbi:domain found in IF2B/IF5-domain-containing protein [Catenaria anguillulae PL171]|uniref:Domain found in IF2B/IF5-domain-containing protein n=1 Tax=Catenaria anguillulae PL171 TaxID=765915 RepID=A0A1Y2I055_9FUNG|nr:domain found in IF2B/IF5-domain-containing protein [Catenaria anguillulae PL171]